MNRKITSDESLVYPIALNPSDSIKTFGGLEGWLAELVNTASLTIRKPRKL